MILYGFAPERKKALENAPMASTSSHVKANWFFFQKKRKILPWLIFYFFNLRFYTTVYHPCIVTYPLVLKHFCIGGLRLPSIRNFAVGMELIHLPHRL